LIGTTSISSGTRYAKKVGIGWTNFAAVAMVTKRGIHFFFDSFHQTSSTFVGISTVVCGRYWVLKKFQMAAVAMATKVQKVLNGNRTVDPFET
jgi:hypothetical protein